MKKFVLGLPVERERKTVRIFSAGETARPIDAEVINVKKKKGGNYDNDRKSR